MEAFFLFYIFTNEIFNKTEEVLLCWINWFYFSIFFLSGIKIVKISLINYSKFNSICFIFDFNNIKKKKGKEGPVSKHGPRSLIYLRVLSIIEMMMHNESEKRNLIFILQNYQFPLIGEIRMSRYIRTR